MAREIKQDSYNKHSDEELYKIVKGFENHSVEQKKRAQETLDKRGFDFEKADQRIEHLRQNKQEQEEEQKHPLTIFLLHYFPLILALVSAFYFISFANELSSSKNDFHDDDLQSLQTKRLVFGLSSVLWISVFFVLKAGRKKKS